MLANAHWLHLLLNLKLVNCENIVSYGICFFLGLGFVAKGFSFNPKPVTHQLYEHRDIFFSPLKLMFYCLKKIVAMVDFLEYFKKLSLDAQ